MIQISADIPQIFGMKLYEIRFAYSLSLAMLYDQIDELTRSIYGMNKNIAGILGADNFIVTNEDNFIGGQVHVDVNRDIFNSFGKIVIVCPDYLSCASIDLSDHQIVAFCPDGINSAFIFIEYKLINFGRWSIFL